MNDDPFPGSSADFYEQIQVLKAEVESWKAKYKKDFKINVLEVVNLCSIVEEQDEDILKLKAENAELKRLVAEMSVPNIKQRAREATR